MSFGSQNPTPGQPMDFGWLLPLLTQVASQSPVSQLSSLPVGVPASGINTTAGPEVLYASGMLDPTRIGGLVEDRYIRLLADHQARLAELYGDLPLPPPQVYTYQTEQYFSARPDVGEVFADIVSRVENGTIATPDEAKATLVGLASSSNIPSELRNRLVADQGFLDTQVERFFTERSSFAKDLAEYNQKYGARRAAADQQAAALNLAPPTKQDAYAEVVTEMGAPQLAALPSPTERFELPLSQFADAERLAGLAGQSREAVSRLESPRMDVLRRALEQQNKLAQSYQGRANQELARQFAEQQTEPGQMGFMETIGSRFGEALAALPEGAASIAGRLGARVGAGASDLLATIFTGRSPKREQEKAARQTAMQGIAAQEFARLQAGQPAPRVAQPRPRTAEQLQVDQILGNLGFNLSAPDAATMQLIRGNKEARQLRRDQVRAQRFARAAVQKALKEQAKAEDFLFKAGITPYTQTSAQLLLNAAMQGSKKKN